MATAIAWYFQVSAARLTSGCNSRHITVAKPSDLGRSVFFVVRLYLTRASTLNSLCLIFPLEWCKDCRFITPFGFAKRIDNKWKNYHNNSASKEYGIPHCIAAHGNLCRWDKAQHKCQQRAQEANARDYPHCGISAQAEWSLLASTTVAQYDGRSKHQHIHHKIEKCCELRQYLIERLHRWHNHKEERQECNDNALNKQDIALHSIAIFLLEEWRKIARFTHSKDTLGRSRHPSFTCPPRQ